jgi:cysteinyl-tRNA synthetase
VLKLYNTLHRKIEEFKPISPLNVGMYSCGPTVYHYPHIGNLRTYVGTDILRRVLEVNGFKVFQVMNITDVGHLTSDGDTGEDKLEKSAKKEGKNVWDLAEYYTADFWDSIKKLNIQLPKVVCKATDHIAEMIALIRRLEQKKLTYRIEDGIYFDTSKLSDYGKLAKLDIKGLRAGARIDVVSGKKNSTDFALWKFSYSGGRPFNKDTDDIHKKRQMEWKSPWGLGFPGWHIECSAMSMKYLGEAFDIHSGGIDHIPVHHTNEIAQSEGATGKLFVRYWIHFAHLIIDEEKMSKSLGNFITKTDIEKKGFNLLDLRYLFLNTNYRTTSNFSWKAIASASQALKKLREKVAKYHTSAWSKSSRQNSLTEKELKYKNMFYEAFNNDMNIPKALGIMWKLIEDESIAAAAKYQLILDFDRVFGLSLDKVENTADIPEEIMMLVGKRNNLRNKKEWEESDRIRKEIEEKGYSLEDTNNGVNIIKSQ